MLTVMVDGENMPVSEETLGNLETLLQRVALEVNQRRRVVIELKINGVDYQGPEDPSLKDLQLSAIKTIEIKTEGLRKVSIRILYEAARFVARIVDELRVIAEKIQSRHEGEAFERLQQALNAWVEIYRSVAQATTALGLEFGEYQVKDKTLDVLQQEILDCLYATCEELEQGNYLELSDTLEFDLAPKLRDIQEGLYKMIAVAEKKLH